MNNNLQIFDNDEFGNMRMLMIDDEPWFVGKDVAKALGYSNHKDALGKHVDDEDRRGSQIATPSGEQEMTIINESGLYSLIFGSKLESAKRFKRWVTSEVLPAIRRTGSYKPQDDEVLTGNQSRIEDEAGGETFQTGAFRQTPFRLGKRRARQNWFNFMLSALEKELGLSKDNMLHQAYESIEFEGTSIGEIKARYVEETGLVDCSTFEAVANDRIGAAELADVLHRNMEIAFIKRCLQVLNKAKVGKCQQKRHLPTLPKRKRQNRQKGGKARQNRLILLLLLGLLLRLWFLFSLNSFMSLFFEQIHKGGSGGKEEKNVPDSGQDLLWASCKVILVGRGTKDS